MACLIDAWRHIHLPPPSPSASSHQAGCIREIKKIVLLSEQFVAGDEQHRLSLHGGHPHSPQHRLFLPLCSACLPRSWFCPCHPPPTGRLCARPVGGGPVRRLLYFQLAVSSSCGVARWLGDTVVRFSFGKNPSSNIIRRCFYACIHVRTHCHSLAALSLSLSSSSVDRCIV